MSEGNSVDGVGQTTGAWKARKSTQSRGSTEPSTTSSRNSSISGQSRSDNSNLAQSHPSIARKTISVDSTIIRPIPVRPVPQVSVEHVNVSAKRAKPREWASKSTGSVQNPDPPRTSLLGQADSSTLSRPRHTPRKSPPTYLSDFPVSAKSAKRSPSGKAARISSTSLGVQAVDPTVSAAPTTGLLSAAPTKSYRSLLPLWQQLDNEYEEHMQLHKRDRDGNALIKRISSRTSRRGSANNAEIFLLNADAPNHMHAHIGPNLRLRSPGVPDASDSDDEPRYRPQARLAPNRKAPGIQHVVKAARKYRSIESSPESDSDASDTSTSLSSSGKSTAQVDELDSDQYDSEPRHRANEDIEMDDLIPRSKPSERLVFNTPPPITVPLPTSPARVHDTFDSEPSTALLSAVQALTLPTIRMQTTKQLPFLLRNLRKGFYSRCRKFCLPIYHDGRDIVLQVHYEYAGGITYKAEVSKWQCPLCNLFGTFPTREMLNFHLQMDHLEVYYDWQELNDSFANGWKLQLVIPQSLEPEAAPTPNVGQTPQQFSSPFPSLSLSPPLETPSIRDPTPLRISKKEPVVSLWFKREPQGPQNSVTPSRTPETSSSTRRSQSATGSVSTSTLTSTSMRTPNSQYPAPPPRENPFGPAATPPYLPAHSDYGGPTVHYSSRPGGSCLFDLLGTLPMGKFGLLDWEVLDREDEIYESDDVKEEYKTPSRFFNCPTVHLIRNVFIANYYKGAIAFVDEYWKIIHKACGWDALRYFLFILLANQFLNGHEIAQVLLHYEKHTGMAFWYD
ncbi:hypothetical protein CPB84DRAFT_1844201 [Gymnopilus junonius]|uniref:Uncharacterized protein n=1 Tax=Gymnopilus junonius TaxID=109634 RepID=A0A9P5NS21_GYMJU|nr:hypothetical protein CPB84DRAFT_1844201 [Gymnopilus junonius]